MPEIPSGQFEKLRYLDWLSNFLPLNSHLRSGDFTKKSSDTVIQEYPLGGHASRFFRIGRCLKTSFRRNMLKLNSPDTLHAHIAQLLLSLRIVYVVNSRFAEQ